MWVIDEKCPVQRELLPSLLRKLPTKLRVCPEGGMRVAEFREKLIDALKDKILQMQTRHAKSNRATKRRVEEELRDLVEELYEVFPPRGPWVTRSAARSVFERKLILLALCSFE